MEGGYFFFVIPITPKIRPQVQARHIEGTPQFEEYKAHRLAKGQPPQSILTVTMEEAQEIVDRYKCTGTVVIQTHKSGGVKIREFTDSDKIIGRYYKDNSYKETKRLGIYYSKNGTHIVPVEQKETK